MNLRNILLGVLIIIIIYVVYIWYFGDGSYSYLSGTRDATKELRVSDKYVSPGTTSDYTFSVWIYVNNWNYKLGQEKIILDRHGLMSVSLDPNVNNVLVSLATYTEGSNAKTSHQCTLENVPLQRWSNVIMTLNNRALDLYLNGKLVRTCVLPGVPVVDKQGGLYVTPDGGFYGYISNLQYINRAINPREAWAIYKAGYGDDSWLSNLFNKYRIKLAFMEDEREVNSIEI
jgi:hypothetical protein